MKTETITVIIPCFNEEEALPVYYQAMQPVMKQMENIDFELLVIDDGSTDHTLLEMKALHQKDPRCKYFSFSRNFGKEAAILCRSFQCRRRLCCSHGCRSAGSTVTFARNVQNPDRRGV